MAAPRIRVEVADALERRSEVLVLKWAQNVYGLDKDVLDRTKYSAVRLEPGDWMFLRASVDFSSRVLLIGTTEMERFDYRDVREFGRRAVEVVGTELPHVLELCLTLHGTGVGLDEREAFRAEVAGIREASLPANSRLETVTVLEISERRAKRLSAVLAELETGLLPTAGLDSAARPHAFVAMPFGEAFDDVFHYGIVGPVERAGLLCERMDRSAFTGDIVETMKRRIRGAAVVVADLSDANPNVYLEVGFAWACEIPTVLLCHRDTEPCFDVRGHRHLRYGTIREAERHLDRELGALLAVR